MLMETKSDSNSSRVDLTLKPHIALAFIVDQTFFDINDVQFLKAL
jgi:hypothetical protein